MLWEEIRGVLKGSLIINENRPKAKLTLKEYMELPNDQRIFQDDLEDIYNLFEKYEKYKENNNYWDDMDLAFNALKNLSKIKIKKYDQVVVDEIQDLSSLHLRILCHFVGSPDGLFMSGDEQQIIYPTRFQWERTKDLIYQ